MNEQTARIIAAILALAPYATQAEALRVRAGDGSVWIAVAWHAQQQRYYQVHWHGEVPSALLGLSSPDGSK